MSELKVRIIELEPLRVASVLGFGETPEDLAWKKLTTWAKAQGIYQDLNQHRIFGFNNPNPSPGSPNYGYEFWITVGPEVEPEGEVEIKEFPGGLYAVTRCYVDKKPYETIPAAWESLVRWREDSSYRHADHQWLEEHLWLDEYPEGDWDLDLYLPIAEG
jgi:DNA gyrase inhibitor GyrI